MSDSAKELLNLYWDNVVRTVMKAYVLEPIIGNRITKSNLPKYVRC